MLLRTQLVVTSLACSTAAYCPEEVWKPTCQVWMPSTLVSSEAAVGFQSVGRPSGTAIVKCASAAAPWAMPTTSTGGWVTLLGRGTIRTITTTIAPTTSRDRIMSATVRLPRARPRGASGSVAVSDSVTPPWSLTARV